MCVHVTPLFVRDRFCGARRTSSGGGEGLAEKNVIFVPNGMEWGWVEWEREESITS